MIVRRIGEHVRAHNWFAVAIDFAIVVVGVFIGIEVANWNQDRQARAEERRYYVQIRDDLADDVRTMQVAIRRSQRNDAAAELALGALAGQVPEDVSNGQVAVAFHRAGFLYLPLVSRGTYDELVSTGNLGLLRNRKLKDAIVEYYAAMQELRQWDQLLRDQQKEYWGAAAGVLPRPVLQASMADQLPQVSQATLATIVSEARSRPRLRDLLIGMAAHQARVRRDSQSGERRARALIQTLDQQLGTAG